MTRLSVQMLGTRGLPNKYGGSETCIEEVGVRLRERGHGVRIFSRPKVTGTDERSYRGMEQVPLWSAPMQNADTLSHCLLAIAWLVRHRRSDDGMRRVLHFHGPARLGVDQLTVDEHACHGKHLSAGASASRGSGD